MPKVKKAKAGHNSIDKELLLSVVERVERLEEDKSGIASDIRDVYAEAKGNGLHNATIRSMLKLRKQDAAERQEQEFLRELYMEALGLGLSILE